MRTEIEVVGTRMFVLGIRVYLVARGWEGVYCATREEAEIMYAKWSGEVEVDDPETYVYMGEQFLNRALTAEERNYVIFECNYWKLKCRVKAEEIWFESETGQFQSFDENVMISELDSQILEIWRKHNSLHVNDKQVTWEGK